MCFLLQVLTDSRPPDVESLRRMHESVKRMYETSSRSLSHGIGGTLDYGCSSTQSMYEPQAGERNYGQLPLSSKLSYPSNTSYPSGLSHPSCTSYPSSTSYSDNWAYTTESYKPTSSQHSMDEAHTDPAYYHTPSTFEEYPYTTSSADVVASTSAATAHEERNSSRQSYATNYSEDLSSQMSKLDVSGSHQSYKSTSVASDYTPNSLGQNSSSTFSATSVATVTVDGDSAPPQTSSRYDATSTSWYDITSSATYDVTASIQQPGYGSISSTPSSGGMTVTSGSGYPVVPTACSTTEQQLRERVRQLEQMVKQKDVTIEEQRSQLKYSGPQKLYQDPTVISPGPATLYSSGSLSSPHHSGLLQQVFGTPPSISPQATMQHLQYYSHTGTPAGTSLYTPQPPPGYPSHRWSGSLSAPITAGQYPSPPGSLPAPQTITPPGTHLVSVLHPHSGPILMPATATPNPAPPRQVRVSAIPL